MKRTILDHTPDGLRERLRQADRMRMDERRRGDAPNTYVDPESIRLRVEAFGVSANRSSAQSIPNVTDTDISFSGTGFDDGGWYDAGSPTTLVAPEGGRYMVQGFLNYQPNSSGSRAIKIFTDGGSGFTAVNQMSVTSGAQTQLATVGLFDLEVGDTLRLVAFQDSGGSLNLAANGAVLTAVRLGSVPTN